MAKVSIVMGSDSDLPIMKSCIDMLKKFDIEYTVNIMSAHRTPAAVAEFATNARANGVKAIIAGAGCAAHLAGVVAAHTTLPVIGVPLPGSDLQGMDALLATVQMPSGVPVATVAIGKAGAANAGLLAAQIIGASDVDMEKKLSDHKIEMAEKVKAKEAKAQEALKSL